MMNLLIMDQHQTYNLDSTLLMHRELQTIITLLYQPISTVTFFLSSLTFSITFSTITINHKNTNVQLEELRRIHQRLHLSLNCSGRTQLFPASL